MPLKTAKLRKSKQVHHYTIRH